jgi:hypothetical protein
MVATAPFAQSRISPTSKACSGGSHLRNFGGTGVSRSRAEFLTRAPIGFDCQSFLTTAAIQIGDPFDRTACLAPGSSPPSHDVRGDFPGFGEKPRIGGVACWCFVSASGQVDSNGHFRAFVSGLKIPFPGNRDRAERRLVRMQTLSGSAASLPPSLDNQFRPWSDIW